MCWYIWGVWKKGNLCVMLRNPYTESKKLKEKKANAAPGDFPPVNKEIFSFGIWPRIKFVFLNIPAGSLNDTRAHNSSRPSRGASPCYFSPSTSCVHLCGGWDTQLTGLILTLAESQNSETMLLSWSTSRSFTHLEAVSAQPLSGVSTDVRALAGRTFSHLLLTSVLSWSCFGPLCCREVNIRPSLTVPNPGSVFQCFQVSVTVRTLSRKAQSNGVMVDFLQRSPFCIRMAGAQLESSLGFLVTLASPTQTVSFSSTTEETKCYKWPIDFSPRVNVDHSVNFWTNNGAAEEFCVFSTSLSISTHLLHAGLQRCKTITFPPHVRGHEVEITLWYPALTLYVCTSYNRANIFRLMAWNYFLEVGQPFHILLSAVAP